MLLPIHPTHPEPRKLRQAADALRAGGIISCPTDTVHAFACSAHSASAISELARLKHARPNKAGLSLICDDLSQLSLYARHVDTAAFRILKRALPGPYTFILNASAEIPKLFKNNRRTVGIRVPDQPIPRMLAAELGHALVVTSVHSDDEMLEYCSDPQVIHDIYGHRLAIVIDAGHCGLEPSTIIDLSNGKAAVVRQGKGDLSVLS